MAVLTDTERQQIWRGLMRYWSSLRELMAGMSAADLRAAVDAADNWADSNAASYNSALPAAFRTNATANQKAVLLAAVILMRHSVGFLRRLFGEVD